MENAEVIIRDSFKYDALLFVMHEIRGAASEEPRRLAQATV